MKKFFWGLGLLALASALAISAFSLFGTWGLRSSPFRASYQLIDAWTEAGGQELKEPMGIAVDPRNGNVLISDTLHHRIVVFDAGGRFIREFGGEGTGRGQFSHAKGVAAGPDGSIYVSDFFQDRIQKFSEAGEFLLSWGVSGQGKEAFDAPAGLAVDGEGRVYVADFYNKVVKMFTSEGKFVSQIGEPGQWGLGRLDYPTDVAVARDGSLLVADAYNYRIQAFRRDGPSQAAWGWHLFGWLPRPSGGSRGFRVPTSVASDPQGKGFHVADSRNHRIVFLDSKGAFVTDWTLPDFDPNIDSPVMIAASRNGKKVYATDIVNHRVVVLALKRGVK